MWTVPFQEYLQFDGVKEGIKGVKKTSKERGMQHGHLVEETIYHVLSQYKGFSVKHTTPQMDVGFGADLLVSYKEEDKNYSMYVDITTTQKDQIEYLSYKGSTTTNHRDAFCYQTEYFKLYFGLKKKHGCWFFYEKPIVVLYVENYVPCTGIALSHIGNIANILMSLNGMLVDKGHGARASQLVRPNIKRYRKEFLKAIDVYE